MAYELGTYRKPGKPDRIARTPSEAVQLHWDGYKHVKPEPAADETVAAPPELTEAEMAKRPEAKDAEVVDLTNEQPKPRNPRR